MDVLNTYGGGVVGTFVFFAIMAGIFALFFIIGGSLSEEFSVVLAGIIFALIAIVFAITAEEPVRHEVTLRPGYVIDATKYEIVEQRGQIFVIEERVNAE